MKSINNDKKLRVQFRLESGCLGPEGTSLIDGFCEFAQREMASYHSKFIVWEIMPRIDKSLPEIQYRLNGKSLNDEQSDRYLKLFEQDISSFKEQMDDRLVEMIEKFFDR